MTAELVAFLRARLDEDEHVAREAATPGDWEVQGYHVLGKGVPPSRGPLVSFAIGYAEHIAWWDPDRVLREIDAKRRRVNAHSRPHECIELSGSGDSSVVDGQPWEHWEPQHTEDHGPCFVLRTEALPYADHPDYREEWKP